MNSHKNEFFSKSDTYPVGPYIRGKVRFVGANGSPLAYDGADKGVYELQLRDASFSTPPKYLYLRNLIDAQGNFSFKINATVFNRGYIFARTDQSCWTRLVWNTSIPSTQWDQVISLNSPTQVIDLRYGDMNGDNKLNFSTAPGTDFDAWTLRSAARVSMTTANTEKSVYYYDTRVDLNRDNFLDSADRNILFDCAPFTGTYIGAAIE
jgi:hypothetical protein